MNHKTFQFTDEVSDFYIKLTDPLKIEHARRVLSGEETKKVHIKGRIAKEPADYNREWLFHLEPASIDFFEIASPIRDASIRTVQAKLNQVGIAFLPDSWWNPLRSRLVKEVEDDDLDGRVKELENVVNDMKNEIDVLEDKVGVLAE